MWREAKGSRSWWRTWKRKSDRIEIREDMRQQLVLAKADSDDEQTDPREDAGDQRGKARNDAERSGGVLTLSRFARKTPSPTSATSATRCRRKH